MRRAVPHHRLLRRSSVMGQHQRPAPGGFFQKLFPPAMPQGLMAFMVGAAERQRLRGLFLKPNFT